MADTVILALANQLLTCLGDKLDDNPEPPLNVCLRAGDQVIQDVDPTTNTDKVCCPGLAYVRIGSMFPSSSFPVPDTEPAKSGNTCFPVAWGLELVMGVVRCVPGMASDSGPSCTDWTLAATRDANDLDAMRKALCCWGAQLPPGKLWLAGTSTVNITGDCIERLMPVTVSIPRCC